MQMICRKYGLLTPWSLLMVIIAIAILATENSARAASFDCAVAQSKSEKTICGDPKLSDLDAKLAKLYEERKALLSSAGQNALRTSQRNWLRVTNQVCADFKPSSIYEGPGSCLTPRYDERLSELESVGERIGPYRFTRIDLLAATPVKDPTDKDGEVAGYAFEHTAYPQIDDPQTTAEIAWNKHAQRKLEKASDCGPVGDYDIDYQLGYANERFISVEWATSMYCHGTPHGLSSPNSENMMLMPALHAITGQEIFGPGEKWKNQLQSLFWNAFTSRGWAPPEDKADDVKKDIQSDVIRPTRWLFTKDGLQFSFDAYQGGCYVCGTEPTTLTWAQLKPLLAPDAPVP
jgi:uncharacterized protein